MSHLAVVVGPAALGAAQLLQIEGFEVLVLLQEKPSARARRKLTGLRLVRAKPGAPPLAPGIADLVMITGAFPTQEPWDLARLARILKPGAALVALSPEASAVYAQVVRAPSRVLAREKTRVPTAAQLSQAFLRAGLARVAQEEFGTWMPVMITIGYATHASAALGALAG